MKHRLALITIGIATVGTTLGTAVFAATPVAQQWEIGPTIRGKNYSVGMPRTPVPTRNGWYFDFPYDRNTDGHVNAVTFAPESLRNKSRIVVRYRVQAASGTRFVPQEQPTLPGTVSIFIQRRGDNWSGRGRHEFYRWYAPTDTVRTIAPGVHRIIVDLADPRWGSVQGRSTAANPAAFDATLGDVARIGLVFGSTSARAHGVFATAPARFELLDFTIE